MITKYTHPLYAVFNIRHVWLTAAISIAAIKKPVIGHGRYVFNERTVPGTKYFFKHDFKCDITPKKSAK